MGDSRILSREDVLGAVSDLPLPGHGQTWARWEYLIDQGRRDLARAKLVESHLDAVAILWELTSRTGIDDGLWAVWAAEPPHVDLDAQVDGQTALIRGRKMFCSGAPIVDHALLTVPHGDASWLVVVDVVRGRADGSLRVEDNQWSASGMARAQTRAIELDGVRGTVVGTPGQYVDREGFWRGAGGVAACWHGGTLAVADLLHARVRQRGGDPLLLRDLGRVAAAMAASRAVLRQGAYDIDTVAADAAHSDTGPEQQSHDDERRRAELVRATVVDTAEMVLSTVRRCLGPAPLAFDVATQSAIDDLDLFIRQHHGDRDLAVLGDLTLRTPTPW